jgi:hypothetical protein
MRALYSYSIEILNPLSLKLSNSEFTLITSKIMSKSRNLDLLL